MAEEKKKETLKSFETLFDDYLTTVTKTYTPEEKDFRKKVFENNMKKIISDFDNLNQKYKIIEEQKENKQFKKILILNKSTCDDCELALNEFIDLTDNEFKESHLLPPVFFDQEQYKPVNKLFDVSDFPASSFHGHDDWVNTNFVKILNDDNFDIFKETLFRRQNPQPKRKLPFNYNSYFIHNHFKKFTLHDDKKVDDDIYHYLFSALPSYEVKKEFTFNDDDDYLKCFNNQKKIQEGRNLQSFYGNNNGFNNNYFDRIFGGSSSSNSWDSLFDTNQNQTSNQNFDSFNNYGNKRNSNNYSGWDNSFSSWDNNSSSNWDTSFNFQNDFSNIWNTPQQNTFKKQTTSKKTTQKKQQTNYSDYIDPWNFTSNTQTETNIKKSQNTNTDQDQITVDGVKIPTMLDWSSKRSLTPVKNQGNCNACYAFGAISGLEAHNVLKNNDHLTFSEQEILDCSETNKACVGGQPFMVYDYIKANGIYHESDYPAYQAKKMKCRKNKNGRKFNKLKGYIFTKTGIKNLLIAATFGPVVVVSYASDHLKYYYKGIFSGQGCDSQLPNHSSLLYGYNLKAPKPYLLFKNNWGTIWGNSGYYKVELGDLNDSNMGHCLLANTPYNTMPLL